jgi:hypothetical protein
MIKLATPCRGIRENRIGGFHYLDLILFIFPQPSAFPVSISRIHAGYDIVYLCASIVSAVIPLKPRSVIAHFIFCLLLSKVQLPSDIRSRFP